jgi:transposase
MSASAPASTGAASLDQTWASLDWAQAHRQVTNLRQRIFRTSSTSRMSRRGSRPVPGGGGSREGASLPAYWRPIYNVLEGHCGVWVANAFHSKAVPGRKIDVKDAEWIADLLRHGLLRPSFIPAPEQRHRRDLTRYRTHLVEERAWLTHRLQAVLEDANIQLAAVGTDVRSASACAILEALVAGATDPASLAELARGRLRTKRALLAQAGVGQFGAHHAFLIAEHRSHLDPLK